MHCETNLRSLPYAEGPHLREDRTGLWRGHRQHHFATYKLPTAFQQRNAFELSC
jgi:hypothetical protein